jgi:hypothetical protein
MNGHKFVILISLVLLAMLLGVSPAWATMDARSGGRVVIGPG